MNQRLVERAWGRLSVVDLAGVLAGGLLLACAEPLPEASDEASATTTSQAVLGRDPAGIESHGGACLPAPTDVPAALAAPADECLKVAARGLGVQIYTCTAGAWVLKAPEANLLDTRGRFLGNHFLGPTWQWRDGSKVKGTKVAGDPGPDPAHDVPWLLLSVPSEDGEGELADVKHIQRLHTVGGVAPAGPCTEGTEARVGYAADYLFYHLRSCQ